MSMLADPRRKQKWTLNPRGKQWSEDQNKFGQKMLEKMGWTSGKGLGAKEQGITEHVRVSYKDDTAGIGFNKDGVDNAWTEHQDSFNDLLQALQKNQSDRIVQPEEGKSELSGKSLELKSKQSRARVHYHKFTRGKDVNKYSSKDLANIFGQKDLNINNAKETQNNETESSDPVGSQVNRGGVITINGGNMADYFTKKAKDYSSSFKSKKQEGTNSESEPEYTGFGYAAATEKGLSQSYRENKETGSFSNYAFENTCLSLSSPESTSDSRNRSKPSGKRKKLTVDNELGDSKQSEEGNVYENGHKNGFVNAALNLECQTDQVCNGQHFEVSRAEFGLANSALDLSDEVRDKKRVTFNDHVEYSIDVVKKRKGKATLDKFEVENKKIKRKRKRQSSSIDSVSTSGFVNEALDVEEVSKEVNDNEINERKSRKSKKRKESRQSQLETIVEIPEEDKEACKNEIEIKRIKVEENIPDHSVPEEELHKKTKKKRKKENEKQEIVAVNENDTEKIAEEGVAENIELKVKKEKSGHYSEEDQQNISRRKKKKKKSIESSVEKCEDVISEIKTQDTTGEITGAEVEIVYIKKKKKKVKKDTDANDLRQETVVNIQDEKDVSDKENESASKVKKPKKKKHEKSVDEIEMHNNNTVHNMEHTNEPMSQATHTPSKSTNNETFVSSSPWNGKAKMSKKLLKYLFHRNSDVHFPGSNIHDIKGYGEEIR